MARVIVWLFVEAIDHTVEEMTDQIGLACDRFWRKGDPQGKTGKQRDTNSWRLESRSEVPEEPLAVAEALEHCLSDILGRIRNRAERFRITAFGRTAGLFIGITAQEAPPLAIGARAIHDISSLGVNLEIDVMGVAPR